jgi:hypothetical protein
MKLKSGHKKRRQESALMRLETTLSLDTKVSKESRKKKLPLTKIDIARIEREIKSLKSSI